ncbi:uncharacterized protein BX664DRAFT_342995 [Halteromyces radiatus]|uniref:uncharacterized protein n=1 Tax=Halteromyces radiatus TaxID=101107 RepID=UPI002220FFCA|nr:uncharacterized protein BX664DRAFT_342995 [Halteromyces radiatus]KAI8078888.1 hypothetical protein BX664DRAFT_342995 [Halteromyces radiatus]
MPFFRYSRNLNIMLIIMISPIGVSLIIFLFGSNYFEWLNFKKSLPSCCYPRSQPFLLTLSFHPLFLVIISLCSNGPLILVTSHHC